MENPEVYEVVTSLLTAHCLVRDASNELDVEFEYAAEDGRQLGRGCQFAKIVLPDVIISLEYLADLLADHFGVVILHDDVVDSEAVS